MVRDDEVISTLGVDKRLNIFSKKKKKFRVLPKGSYTHTHTQNLINKKLVPYVGVSRLLIMQYLSAGIFVFSQIRSNFQQHNERERNAMCEKHTDRQTGKNCFIYSTGLWICFSSVFSLSLFLVRDVHKIAIMQIVGFKLSIICRLSKSVKSSCVCGQENYGIFTFYI